MVVLTLATIALLVVVIRKVHWKKMESSGSNTDNQMKPSEPQYEEIGEPRAQQIQYEEIGEPLAQQTQHFMTHMSNDKELENMFTQRNVCYTSVILSRCPAYSTV